MMAEHQTSRVKNGEGRSMISQSKAIRHGLCNAWDCRTLDGKSYVCCHRNVSTVSLGLPVRTGDL